MEEGVYEMTYLLLHHMRILICTLSRSETIACVYIAYHRLVLLGRGRARAGIGYEFTPTYSRAYSHACVRLPRQVYDGRHSFLASLHRIRAHSA